MEDSMKKLSLVFLVILVMFSLSANGSQDAPAAAEMPEKLVYLTPAWGAPSDEVVAAFEAETGIVLEVATVDIEGSRNRVLTAAAGKTNPADVIFVSADTYSTFQSAGAIRVLDDLADKKMLDTLTGVDQFVIDGDLWAIPLYQQMVMLDYDKSAFGMIGLTASDIKTWDDFESALIAFKEKGIYEYPYAAGIRAWTWYITALSSGSALFDANHDPVFDNPSDPGYKAFERVMGFYKKGLISPERLSSPNPHPSFWAGQAAVHQAWQGSLGIANNPENSKVAPNAAYLVFPEKGNTWLLPAGLTVSAFTKYPEAAMILIDFLTKDMMQRYLFTANGLFPANLDTFDALGKEGAIEGFEEMAEQGKHLVSLPYDQPWYIEFEKEVEQSMILVALEEISSAEALDKLAQFARDLKAEYE
jgi:multiple sugar transport system substrate-binding protein